MSPSAPHEEYAALPSAESSPAIGSDGTYDSANLSEPSIETAERGECKQNAEVIALQSMYESWSLEYWAMFAALLLLAAQGVFLFLLHGRLQSHWSFYFTPSAIIGLLTAVLDISLCFVLANSVGQLKWIHLKSGNQRLTTVQLFDDASRRSLLGSWPLLLFKGGFLGFLGVLTGILYIALPPSCQQVVKTSLVQVSAGQAVVWQALNYSEYSGNNETSNIDVLLPTKAAINGAIYNYGSDVALQAPAFMCPSQNCTFSFYSLGVSSECVETSTHIEQKPGDEWNFTINTDTNFDFYKASPIAPLPNKTIVSFLMTNATSVYCELFYDVQNVTTTVVNGMLYERIDRPWPDAQIEQLTNGTYLFPNGTAQNISSPFAEIMHVSNATYGFSVENPDSKENLTFEINILAARALQTYLASEIFLGSTQPNRGLLSGWGEPDSGLILFSNEITEAIFLSNNITGIASNVAADLSSRFRAASGRQQVTGQSYTYETYYKVDWRWFAPAAAAALITGCFLGIVAFLTKKHRAHVWKNDPLSLIFHGLHDDDRARVESVETLKDMKKRASDFHVRLIDSKLGLPSVLLHDAEHSKRRTLENRNSWWYQMGE